MSIQSIKNIIGVLFLAFGALFNEWFLGKFISIFALSKINARIPVFLIELFCIFIGLVLILIKFDGNSWEKIKKHYKSFIVVTFNLILFFFIINLIVYFAFLAGNISLYREQIFINDSQFLPINMI